MPKVRINEWVGALDLLCSFIAEGENNKVTMIDPAKMIIQEALSFPDEIIDYVFRKQFLLAKATIIVRDMPEFHGDWQREGMGKVEEGKGWIVMEGDSIWGGKHTR